MSINFDANASKLVSEAAKAIKAFKLTDLALSNLAAEVVNYDAKSRKLTVSFQDTAKASRKVKVVLGEVSEKQAKYFEEVSRGSVNAEEAMTKFAKKFGTAAAQGTVLGRAMQVLRADIIDTEGAVKRLSDSEFAKRQAEQAARQYKALIAEINALQVAEKALEAQRKATKDPKVRGAITEQLRTNRGEQRGLVKQRDVAGTDAIDKWAAYEATRVNESAEAKRNAAQRVADFEVAQAQKTEQKISQIFGDAQLKKATVAAQVAQAKADEEYKAYRTQSAKVVALQKAQGEQQLSLSKATSEAEKAELTKNLQSTGAQLDAATKERNNTRKRAMRALMEENKRAGMSEAKARATATNSLAAIQTEATNKVAAHRQQIQLKTIQLETAKQREASREQSRLAIEEIRKVAATREQALLSVSKLQRAVVSTPGGEAGALQRAQLRQQIAEQMQLVESSERRLASLKRNTVDSVANYQVSRGRQANDARVAAEATVQRTLEKIATQGAGRRAAVEADIARRAARQADQARMAARQRVGGSTAATFAGGLDFGQSPHMMSQVQGLINANRKAQLSARELATVYAQVTKGIAGNWNETERRVATAMGRIVSRQNELKNSVSDATTRFQGFGKAVLLSWRSVLRLFVMQQVHHMFRALMHSIRAGIKELTEFQIVISQIRTISQENQLSFQRWSEGVRSLSDNLGLERLDTAKSMYRILSNQIAQGAEAFRFFTVAGRFAKAAVATSEEAVNLLSGALNSFNMRASMAREVSASFFLTIERGRVLAGEMADKIGRLAELANKLGVSLEEINTSIQVLTISGMKFDVASTLLRNVMLKLIRPTDAMKDLMREWGVESGEAALKTFGFVGVLTKLNELTNERGSDLLGDLFGRVRAIQGTMGLTGTSNMERFMRNLEEQQTAGVEKLEEAGKIAFESLGKMFQVEINKIKNMLVFDYTERGLTIAMAATKALGRVTGKDGLAANLAALLNILTYAAAGFTAYSIAVGIATLHAKWKAAAVIGLRASLIKLIATLVATKGAILSLGIGVAVALIARHFLKASQAIADFEQTIRNVPFVAEETMRKIEARLIVSRRRQETAINSLTRTYLQNLALVQAELYSFSDATAETSDVTRKSTMRVLNAISANMRAMRVETTKGKKDLTDFTAKLRELANEAIKTEQIMRKVFTQEITNNLPDEQRAFQMRESIRGINAEYAKVSRTYAKLRDDFQTAIDVGNLAGAQTIYEQIEAAGKHLNDLQEERVELLRQQNQLLKSQQDVLKETTTAPLGSQEHAAFERRQATARRLLQEYARVRNPFDFESVEVAKLFGFMRRASGLAREPRVDLRRDGGLRLQADMTDFRQSVARELQDLRENAQRTLAMGGQVPPQDIDRMRHLQSLLNGLPDITGFGGSDFTVLAGQLQTLTDAQLRVNQLFADNIQRERDNIQRRWALVTHEMNLQKAKKAEEEALREAEEKRQAEAQFQLELETSHRERFDVLRDRFANFRVNTDALSPDDLLKLSDMAPGEERDALLKSLRDQAGLAELSGMMGSLKAEAAALPERRRNALSNSLDLFYDALTEQIDASIRTETVAAAARRVNATRDSVIERVRDLADSTQAAEVAVEEARLALLARLEGRMRNVPILRSTREREGFLPQLAPGLGLTEQGRFRVPGSLGAGFRAQDIFTRNNTGSPIGFKSEFVDALNTYRKSQGEEPLSGDRAVLSAFLGDAQLRRAFMYEPRTDLPPDERSQATKEIVTFLRGQDRIAELYADREQANLTLRRLGIDPADFGLERQIDKEIALRDRLNTALEAFGASLDRTRRLTADFAGSGSVTEQRARVATQENQTTLQRNLVEANTRILNQAAERYRQQPTEENKQAMAAAKRELEASQAALHGLERELRALRQVLTDLSRRRIQPQQGERGAELEGEGFARGGIVPNGDIDKVPAWLTPGEFVINRKSATEYAGILAQINAGTYRKSLTTAIPTSFSALPTNLLKAPVMSLKTDNGAASTIVNLGGININMESSGYTREDALAIGKHLQRAVKDGLLQLNGKR